MSTSPKSPHSARSRAPIDEASIKWWNIFGNTDMQYTSHEEIRHFNEPKFKDKSTNTSTKFNQESILKQYYHVSTPKDKILNKWRAEQDKLNFDKAKEAVINSLKEKFGGRNQGKICRVGNRKRADIGQAGSSIEIYGDNVEETSNSNVNHETDYRKILSSREGWNKVEVSVSAVDDGCHARMGPGGKVAQWRLDPHGSRAAGAGGTRGNTTDDMPVSLDSRIQLLMN